MSDARNEALVEALAQPRFELIPMEGAIERAALLPEGAKVTVTCSPTRGIESTLLLGEKLLERGFRIVPHIAARLMADRAHLNEIVGRLDDLGVREIFVIGAMQRSLSARFRALSSCSPRWRMQGTISSTSA